MYVARTRGYRTGVVTDSLKPAGRTYYLHAHQVTNEVAKGVIFGAICRTLGLQEALEWSGVLYFRNDNGPHALIRNEAVSLSSLCYGGSEMINYSYKRGGQGCIHKDMVETLY